ncbi:hypothetical protein AMECASPLE_039480 [Ameca splendens]|uniref:Uncharacterized protein n=1 Tax=Ameca splendens TaxID=208324 RepID=A0ABV0YVQ0_9TELE
MAVRRLEEEKRILVREMDHHWKSLLAYEDTPKKLSYLSSSGSFKSWSCPLTDEGLKGLQSIILREREQVKQVKLQCTGVMCLPFCHLKSDQFVSHCLL